MASTKVVMKTKRPEVIKEHGAKSEALEVVDSHSSEPDSSPNPPNKRKRPEPTEDELEIDITAPEPLSKKQKRLKARQEKEGKDGKTKISKTGINGAISAGLTEDAAEPEVVATAGEIAVEPSAPAAAPKKSEYGIWIGNLPWTTTQDLLKKFFAEKGEIDEDSITRIHMPAPKEAPSRGHAKPQNKGFAYVDFSTEEALQKAIATSETLMGGRRVLIKNAKSFVGRPEKKEETKPAEGGKAVAVGSGSKPPNKRVFVGNLGFDITKEDLEEHFGQCGDIADLHMATFEDTGKCKGYAWVTFAELEASAAAARGFVFKKQEDSDNEDEEGKEKTETAAADAEHRDMDGAGDDEPGSIVAKPHKKKKQLKPRKWFINRIHGRTLKIEYAEDAGTRYKKRFGKEGTKRKAFDDQGNAIAEVSQRDPAGEANLLQRPQSQPQQSSGKTSHERRAERRKQEKSKVDARTVAPGAAQMNAQRASAAIQKPEGQKITFD